MTNLISIKDLNTTINHEPRLEDMLLGEKLGYENPRKIRELIKRNIVELEAYGGCPTVGRLVEGNQVTVYYLNEAQALLICMFSRTEKAAEVRKAIIEVFMAYRNAHKRAEMPILEESGGRAFAKYQKENLAALEKIMAAIVYFGDLVPALLSLDYTKPGFGWLYRKLLSEGEKLLPEAEMAAIFIRDRKLHGDLAGIMATLKARA